MRAVWLVLVAVLTLAGCSAEVTGEPGKDDAPVVGPVDLVVPIELHPVMEQGASSSTDPSVSQSATPPATQLPDPSGELLTLSESVMTIERLDRAEVMFDKVNSTWALSVDLTDEDAAAFADWTANHVDERLAMVVDGEVIIAPTIQSAITDGIVHITGDYTQDDVTELLDKITGRR